MVSLSEFQYGDDADPSMNPRNKFINPPHVEENKIDASRYGSTRIESKISTRSEFIPELAAAGVYHNPMHSKDEEPLRYLTPDSDESEALTAVHSRTNSLYQLP